MGAVEDVRDDDQVTVGLIAWVFNIERNVLYAVEENVRRIDRQ